MKPILTVSTAFLSLAGAAFAQGSPADAVAQSAAMVENCLQSPSRACALGSALMVTAEEELAITRVDSLIEIADSFARLGDVDRARATLELARQAADDIGISIGTEQKLADIAPIDAAIGYTERAIATAEGLSDPILRVNALGNAALALARHGKAAEAERLLDRIDIPLVAMRYAVDLAEALAESGETIGDLAGLERRLGAVDNRLLKALGQSRLAVLEARAGRVEEAQRLYAEVEDALPYIGMPEERARLFAGLASVRLALGDRPGYEDYAGRAANLAKGIRSDLDRMAALADVITALSAGGHVDQAVALARNVTDLRDLNALVERLSRRKLSAGAVLPLASHIETTLARSESRFERDRSRLALARALAASGSIGPAVAVIGAIESDDQQAQALAFLAPALD